jgi:hypothetical protein
MVVQLETLLVLLIILNEVLADELLCTQLKKQKLWDISESFIRFSPLSF